jgi:non-specific serine/threonine protein kinase
MTRAKSSICAVVMRDGARLPDAVAEALGVMVPPGSAATEAVCRFLEDKHLLLIIDNCEQVAQAAAVVIDELLGGGPTLRVLATSREPLKIAGEALYELHPLPIPSDTATGVHRSVDGVRSLI